MLDYFCSRCRYSYSLKHPQTYSLRGRSQRILESTTVEEYSYVYTGGNLMQMVLKTTTTPAGGTATTTTETLNFTYDASGTPLSVNFSGSDYYYVTNIQGDIMAILNTSGEPVAQYNYDAWGKLYSTTGTLASTLGEANPLTYRGYVYDHEIGYYYLQSRYYDPEIGRFINADNYPTTAQGLTGNNMFAYCGNNPVSRADNGGEFWSIVVGAAVGAVLAAASEFASQVINHVVTGESIDWGDVAASAAGGAVYGGVMAATGSNTAASLASTATTSVITGVRNGDSIGTIIVDTAKNTMITAVTCVAPKIINKSLSGKYRKLNARNNQLSGGALLPTVQGRRTKRGKRQYLHPARHSVGLLRPKQLPNP